MEELSILEEQCNSYIKTTFELSKIGLKKHF